MFERYKQHAPAHDRDMTLDWTDWSLRLVLWLAWTLLVIGVGVWSYRSDLAAQHPLNTIGLMVHCTVAGILGMIVITMIELHIEPERFTGR